MKRGLSNENHIILGGGVGWVQTPHKCYERKGEKAPAQKPLSISRLPCLDYVTALDQLSK